MTSAMLRSLARTVLQTHGLHGFVRFGPEGGCLLLTDAFARLPESDRL